MKTTKELIKNGKIFQVEGVWYRKCSVCGNKCGNSKLNFPSGLVQRIGRPCNKCRAKITGKKNKGKLLGNKNPFYGKKHSNEILEKNILWHLGKPTWSSTHKEEMSKRFDGVNGPRYGKKHTKESKRKMRIAKLNWLEKNGVVTNVDKGSPEWFEKYNRENGLNLKPKRFWDIGYDADGYDSEKHIWVEYDTKYHNKPNQIKKDMVRDRNIIEYFESIGRPLTEYKRYSVVKDTINTIYKT